MPPVITEVRYEITVRHNNEDEASNEVLTVT